MRTDYMKEARERIYAAGKYINDFKLEYNRFLNTHPYEVVCEEELQGEAKILRYRFLVRSDIPPEVRIPIRSCLAELRDILDNLVFGLSQVVGEPDTCPIDFPIFLTESSVKERCYNKWVRHNQPILAKFPIGAERLIKSLQPFNPYKGSQMGISHPIYILNKLVVQNKHKVPIHIAGVHVVSGIVISNFNFVGTLKVGEPRILEHNSIIMELPVAASKPTGNFQAQISIQIAFDKDCIIPNFPVYRLLVDMHDFVSDEVVAKFELFFPK